MVSWEPRPFGLALDALITEHRDEDKLPERITLTKSGLELLRRSRRRHIGRPGRPVPLDPAYLYGKDPDAVLLLERANVSARALRVFAFLPPPGVTGDEATLYCQLRRDGARMDRAAELARLTLTNS